MFSAKDNNALARFIASKQFTKLSLNNISVETPAAIDKHSVLYQSVKQLGILQPVWIFQSGALSYIVDGRRRIACLRAINDQIDCPAFIVKSDQPSRALAVLVRLHLNPHIDVKLLNQTTIELLTELSAEDLIEYAELLRPFISPSLISGMAILTQISTELASEWMERKIPIKSLRRAQHLPPSILSHFKHLLALQLSNGDWRRILELMDEVYRRDKNEAVLVALINDAPSGDELIERLQTMRAPMQNKRRTASKIGWEELKPPRGTEISQTSSKEGSTRISMPFSSAAELEKRLEELRQRLTDEAFRAYIDRL